MCGQDPRVLIFEFCQGVVLRPAQVELVGKLVRTAVGGGSVCHQMLMGEGKTTVISPLLALMLADGSQLVLQIIPAPLLRFTLQVIVCSPARRLGRWRATAIAGGVRQLTATLKNGPTGPTVVHIRDPHPSPPIPTRRLRR